MPTIFDTIVDLKTKAKNRRDLERYDRAAGFVQDAIALAARELGTLEFRAKMASELSDCYGLLGGIERRWALLANASEKHAGEHLRKSVAAYDQAWNYESGDYGVSSSYGMVNRLVTRVLADPNALTKGYVTNLGEGIEPVAVLFELEQARDKIEASKRAESDYWAAADLALVQLLLGKGDPAGSYSKFIEKSPPDYALNSALDVLGPLSDRDLDVKEDLRGAVKLLTARLVRLQAAIMR
jgi:hypothetical protein